MITTLVLFFAVVIVTVILFAGWVVVTGTRSVWRLATGRVGDGPGGTAAPRCRTVGCRVANPTGARFCRRCGSALGQPMAAAARATLSPPAPARPPTYA